MPTKRVKTTVKQHQHVDANRLLGYVFSNEFSILQQDQYNFLRQIIRNPGQHTKIGASQYEVPVDIPLAKLILRYFDICQYKMTELNGSTIPGIQEVERIRIQETGTGDIGNTKQDYEKLESNRVRFVFNFRPTIDVNGVKKEVNSHVALGIRINKNTSVNMPLIRAFSTVLPEALSTISIDSGNLIGHRTQGASIFVIIDAKVHNNILNLIANKMMNSAPISGDQLLKALEHLQKENNLGSLKDSLSSLTGTTEENSGPKTEPSA